MNEKIKVTALKVKNHVKRQKWAYAWGSLAIAAIVLQQRNIKEFYKFLEEKGIDPVEFYGDFSVESES